MKPQRIKIETQTIRMESQPMRLGTLPMHDSQDVTQRLGLMC